MPQCLRLKLVNICTLNIAPPKQPDGGLSQTTGKRHVVRAAPTPPKGSHSYSEDRTPREGGTRAARLKSDVVPNGERQATRAK